MTRLSLLPSARALRMTKIKRLGACCLLASVLSACAGLQPPAPPVEVGGTSPAAAQTYRGRFAVRYEHNGENKNAYGNFLWQQNGDTVTLQLINPLGQTQAIVHSAPRAATLELPGRAPVTGPHLEDVMRNTLGFEFPVSGLRYWLQLQAAPDSRGEFQRDPQTGRPAQLRQDGWTIDYQSYFAGTPTRVKRINISRQLDGEPLEVRLVIDE